MYVSHTHTHTHIQRKFLCFVFMYMYVGTHLLFYFPPSKVGTCVSDGLHKRCDFNSLTRDQIAYNTHKTWNGYVREMYVCIDYLKQTCSNFDEKLIGMVSQTMDLIQMDICRFLNEFMHLSVSKVSQWHSKHVSQLWSHHDRRHLARKEPKQFLDKSIKMHAQKKINRWNYGKCMCSCAIWLIIIACAFSIGKYM